MPTLLKADDLIESVAAALQYISYYHPSDYIAHLARAYAREESPAAKDAIAQILTNSRMCAEGHRPICQDTGIVTVFVKWGMQCQLDVDKSLQDVIDEGVRRAGEKGEDAVEWVCGNAESLPFPDASFDAYTIAFGIRNVTHIDVALKEARRVLKPCGRFLCLEFSKVEVPGLDTLYDAYSFKLMPKIGGLVAKDEDSYRYLAESIRRFPPQAKFAQMIADAGLEQVKVRNLSGGIAAMHSAWRL